VDAADRAGPGRRPLRRARSAAAAADGILTRPEQELLFRDRDADWTAADVPLLDEAAELIGEDVTALARQQARSVEAARERSESLEFARRVLEQTGDSAPW
jgi:hypothetical protein